MIITTLQESARMARILFLAAGALALSACSTMSAAKPAKCDGKSRRPVNIHGSILPGSPVPPVTATPAPPPVPGPDGRPAAQPQPKKVSGLARPKTYGSC